MAECSSEIFRVLFKHGLGTFSCFSSCLSFSFMSPTFFGVRGRVLSLLSSWANSFAAFLSVSNMLWTRRTVLLPEGASSFKALVRLQSLLESFSRYREAVFSYHCFLVCRSFSLVNSALALLYSAVFWSEGLFSMSSLAPLTASSSYSSCGVEKGL